VLAGLASLFILAFLAPWLGDRLAARFGYLAALTSFVLFGWYASQLPAVTHGPTRVETISWLPTLGADLTLRLDGLGLLFALLVTGIGALIALYSVAYLEHHPRRRAFWVAFLAFEAAMLGLVLADDVILLFVFWELTSITSFFLIGLENERERARTSATQALIVTGSGGLALLTGLLILVQRTGSLRLSEILAQGPLPADGLVTTAFLLILLGAAAKSAQVPLHFWLPNAMEAPTPVSAYLHSATMVKAGVYLLARMTPAFGEHPWWQPSLGVLGGATALVGALLAVQQRDLKRLLAYSTISALGTLVFLLSFGEPGWLPFALFLLAHALYKGGAFLLAGAIDHATGERVLDRLGGLAGLFPGLAIVAGLVVLAAAGLPPTLSFVAKELVLETSWHELPLPGLLVLLAALSGQTAVAWLLVRPFVGQPRTAPEHAHAPAWQLLTAPALLGAAASLSGFLTSSLGPLASAVVASLSGHEPTSVKLALWHGLTPALGLSLLVLLLGGALAVSWPIALRLGDRLRTTESWSPTAGALAAWGSESWYFRTLAVINSLAIRQTRLLQSGYLRVYVMVTVLTLVSLSLLTVGRYRAELLTHWSPPHLSAIDVVDASLALIILVAALVAVRATERLAAIAALGALGFSLAVLYARFSAPDLAITQVLVDTLTVVLLVFAFYRLPRYARLSTTRARVRDAIVAMLFGMTMSLFAFLMIGSPARERISTFFLEQSYPAAHGRNVVNVILVDFRALDTLGEITVLGLAGLGVTALLYRRRQKEEGT